MRARRPAVRCCVTQQRTTALGLTVSQAALHLGVSIATVRRWSNAGHLQSTRTPGGQRRFTIEQLDAFVDSLAPRRRDVA